MKRRLFLKGAGVTLGLPLLESIGQSVALAQMRPANAAQFVLFMRQANGVAQEIRNGDGTVREAEMFWPRALGELTDASMADRAVSELTAIRSKLLMVKGTRYWFDGRGCGHSGGGNQCLTANQIDRTDPNLDRNRSRAVGESVDFRIAREINPMEGARRRDPLTLMAGPPTGYIAEVLSYGGARDLRGAQRNPWNAYQAVLGMTGSSESEFERIRSSRQSVNDVLRDQMRSVLGRPELSRADRDRLQLHFDSIRDLERRMSCQLPMADADALRGAVMPFAREQTIDGMRQTVLVVDSSAALHTLARLHCDVLALAVACGYTTSGTLQVGNGNDGTPYALPGFTGAFSYHWISHRIQGDGDMGASINDAQQRHHQIDRMHARLFKYLCDKLNERRLPDGTTLLDKGMAVWVNDLATGPPHGYSDVPWIIAGSGNGALRQNTFIDARASNRTVPHNLLLNTLINAVGINSPRFGEASLPAGQLDAIKARA
ncbi:MAG: DUF1552 domain-containing protein [Deltaproteobacteria bacterium]|nr:DUF1552 domain-containing protein [Deltaproteobacteria bacterium]